MSLKPIQILINAKDNASGVFDTLQKKVAAVGVAVLGYFGIRSFFGAVQGAAELEAKLSEVQAVSGATADEMQRMRKAAEDAGASTKFTATESAEALGNLARAGLDVNESISALPGVLSLAQAGKIGLGEASDVTTQILAGFNLEARKSGLVADVLAKGADASKTSVLGLGQGLSYAAPTAKALNLSLETTVALLGKFADGGIDASRGGTALNAILSQFLDPASKFRKELAAMGIVTGDFEQALHQMAAAGPGAGKAILAVGTEAGPALRSLLNQGIGAFDELKAALDGAGGSAAATAATMENNLLGSVRGLGSVWDTVKNTLTTPVLPVLRDGVIQLTTALRGAVADGTIGKFGEAIAAAFKSGIEWVRQFMATVDFTKVAADMRAFADRTGEVFAQIGEYATNAGNTVKLAYGVMSSGVNVVLASVYGIGTVFAEVASKIMSGIALLREGLAKVSFGGLSAGFKEAADDARESAGAFGAVADAMRAKAKEALGKVGDGANTTREAWAGLTTEFQKTGKAAAGSAESLAAIAEQIEKVGREAAAARKATIDKKEADEAAAAAVKKLQAEYRALIASGDLQGAAQKINEINQALRGTPSAAGDAAKAAGASADAINAAFERMGIQSKAALDQAAATAKADFELIKQSGQATAEGLQRAFQKYAEASIAANGGTATETLKAEAAMRGLELTASGAGKTIERSMDDSKEAVDGFAKGVAAAVAQLQSLKELQGFAAAGGDLSDVPTENLKKAQADLLKQGGALSSPEYIKLRNELMGRGAPKTDAEGFTLDKAGNRLAMGGELNTLTGIANFLKQAGLDDEQAKSVALEFSDGKGGIPYFSNPGQMKYGGPASTISEALLKAAELTTFGLGSKGATAVGRRYLHDIRLDDAPYPVTTHDEQSASNLETIIAQLARDKRRAM